MVILRDIFSPIGGELEATLLLVKASIPQNHQYLASLCAPLTDHPGKCIRPGLLLLFARMMCSDLDSVTVVPAAAALELLHWASLVHDDVIDGAMVRRGVPTINATTNSATAILVGDFLFSRAILLLSGYGQDVLETVADLMYELVLGQLAEQRAIGLYGLTEDAYLRLIDQKTARFLATACGLGARLGGASPAMISLSEEYGHALGMVYQLRDDLLDITGDVARLGKATGMDAIVGVETLPAIRARNLVPEQYHSVVARLDVDGNLGAFQELLWECGALDYTEDHIERYTKQGRACLEGLPPGVVNEGLGHLLSYVVSRVS